MLQGDSSADRQAVAVRRATSTNATFSRGALHTMNRSALSTCSVSAADRVLCSEEKLLTKVLCHCYLEVADCPARWYTRTLSLIVQPSHPRQDAAELQQASAWGRAGAIPISSKARLAAVMSWTALLPQQLVAKSAPFLQAACCPDHPGDACCLSQPQHAQGQPDIQARCQKWTCSTSTVCRDI